MTNVCSVGSYKSFNPVFILIHSCQPSRNGRDSTGILGLVPVMPTVLEWAGQSRNGRDSPGMLGLVPVMLVMSRICTHLAIPSAGFHSLMAVSRILSVLSNLVLFDTHKASNNKNSSKTLFNREKSKLLQFWLQCVAVCQQ